MRINNFQDLEIWRISTEVAILVYKISNNAKFAKDFGLKDQIRRAVVSISSNIAEGFEMSNNNDFIRYLRIAKGSAGEARTQLFLSFELEYISSKEFKEIDEELALLSAKIGKFTTYLINKKNSKEFATR